MCKEIGAEHLGLEKHVVQDKRPLIVFIICCSGILSMILLGAMTASN